jgi:cyclic pyranopterin phosphate synthase
MTLLEGLSGWLGQGALKELALTTNGTQLQSFAPQLAAIGIRRINVSLDTLDRETFARITRRDALPDVLAGIDAALAAGLSLKLNVVALRRDNLHAIPDLIVWAHARGMDVSLIETMPLGDIEEDRTDQFVSLAHVRQTLSSFWTLQDVDDTTGGPSRYVRIRETGGRVGFISPLSHNFCASCNRVRLTCTGRLYLCLGQDEHVDFRQAMRSGASDDELRALLVEALRIKPKAHDFRIAPHEPPATARHMSLTGG